MRTLVLFCLVIIITGCSRPINKRITEELSTEELNRISKTDPSFLEFYSNVFENDCYKHFLNDKTLQVSVGDITYRNLYQYYQLLSDSTFTHSIIEVAAKNWVYQYDDAEKTFDSMMNYWSQYVETKSLDKYIKVEFDHIQKGDYGIYDLFLKITPEKQKLRGVIFSFDLVSKETNKIVVNNMYSDYIGDINKPIVFKVIDARDKFRNYVEDNNLSNEEIIANYEIKYRVINILLENFRRLDEEVVFDSVPDYIKTYLTSPSPLLKEAIIKAHIDNNYISFNKHNNNYLQEKLDSISPQCYKFYHLISDCNDY